MRHTETHPRIIILFWWFPFVFQYKLVLYRISLYKMEIFEILSGFSHNPSKRIPVSENFDLSTRFPKSFSDDREKKSHFLSGFSNIIDDILSPNVDFIFIYYLNMLGAHFSKNHPANESFPTFLLQYNPMRTRTFISRWWISKIFLTFIILKGFHLDELGS